MFTYLHGRSFDLVTTAPRHRRRSTARRTYKAPVPATHSSRPLFSFLFVPHHLINEFDHVLHVLFHDVLPRIFCRLLPCRLGSHTPGARRIHPSRALPWHRHHLAHRGAPQRHLERHQSSQGNHQPSRDDSPCQQRPYNRFVAPTSTRF